MNDVKAVTILDNEPFLRQVSKEVDLNDSNLKDDIAVLEKYCKDNEVFAMAAVQLGIPKRLIYIKNTNLEITDKLFSNKADEEAKNYNEARVLINPRVIKREGLTQYWEACASCLDNCGRVLRPYKIFLEYYDLEGNKHNTEFVGFESTVLSHELDHLDGILHIDIAEEILIMPQEERKKFRQKEENKYKVYSESGDFEMLKENIGGKVNSLK